MKKEVTQLGDFNPLVVHYRDSDSKRVTSAKPFRCIVHKGVRFYEYPKGSGNLWFEDRHPAGRLNDNGDPVRGKAHEEWIPPVTQDQKVGHLNKSLEQENKKLMAELAEIKREKEMNAKLGDADKKTVKTSKASVKSK